MSPFAFCVSSWSHLTIFACFSASQAGEDITEAEKQDIIQGHMEKICQVTLKVRSVSPKLYISRR